MLDTTITTSTGMQTAVYVMGSHGFILEWKEVQENSCPKTLTVHSPQAEETPVSSSKQPQDANLVTETKKDAVNNPPKTTNTDTALKKRGLYRTKKKTKNTDKVPDYLPVITNKKYRHALTLNKDTSAHLLFLPDSSKLEYDDDILYLDGQLMNYEELSRRSTEDNIEKINFLLLNELYSVILYKFLEYGSKDECDNEKFTIYYPDLSGRFRKSKKEKATGNTSKSDWKSEEAAVLNDNMALLGRLVGIINAGTANQSVLPVLTDYRYSPDSNTIHFSSPYMTKLVSDIYKTSIRKDKKGEPIIKNGKPQMYPAYSFLISSDIAKERNKKAVEIVQVVVTLIEQAGNHNPNIRANTIIDRTCLLRHSLMGKDTSTKNLLLKRAFSKAWELLKSKTALQKVYKDIQLPSPKDIPTTSNLDMVFRFPHIGKSSKS